MNNNALYVVGIDPGSTGSIVLLQLSKMTAPGTAVLWWKLADTSLRDVWIILGGCKSYPNVTAYIEKLHAMPTGHIANWVLGYSVGTLEAFLTAHQIPFDRVLPSHWQKEFGLWRKKANESDTQKKNRHKAKAEELFPEVKKITHANADGLLIAEWGRRAQCQPKKL